MTIKHIHQFRRINIARDGNEDFFVMKCTKDNCNHYTPMRTKLSAPLLKGSLAECSRCHEVFVLNKRALRMENPCCEDCIKRKPNKKLKSADEFFESLTKDLIP